MEKIDCFAYMRKDGHGACWCLNKLYCAECTKCHFYNNQITRHEIEKALRSYGGGSRGTK